jgi:two-component system chemotaxis response regulator CheB
MPIRVLVVDDSAVVRHVLRKLIEEDPELQVAGVAAHGRIALAMLEQNVPDIVTLDIEMPELDGLATLLQLRKSYPTLPVIMFSTLTERGAVATLEALSLGATDYVTKPTAIASTQDTLASIRSQLIPRIKALSRKVSPRTFAPIAQTPIPLSRSPIEVVAIGASTGGPNALAELLGALPASFPVPIAIVQHMPPTFTRFLAERLSRLCRLPVREATEGSILLPGTVWIAAGDRHLVIAGKVGSPELRLLATPPENSCRPSVDVLFRSVAKVFASHILAIVMTGMGQDGLRGSIEVRASGGRVWAQDEATSVVWGMPGFVAQNGLAERVLPLPAIGPELVRAVLLSRQLTSRSKSAD